MKLLSNYRINNFDNLEIVRKVNNSTVGWTLGHMIELINRDNFLPSEEPPRKLNKDGFIPAIVISSIFAFLTVLFLGFLLLNFLKN
ncbi:unnamed protein product [Brachionus calyciflorus]|uniref:Uncharacterized protein n=1 Tax=Brachionus calyciflorus TaxID=104777 RepID=A0A813NT24_9BILA|nr:unnamed protein product [Brachionus calyciflorus]